MAGQHVMDAEQLVVADSFHQVEQTPPDKHRTDEHPTRPGSNRLPCRAEEHGCSNQRNEPNGEMKESVLCVLPLQMRNGGRLAMLRNADQVMPAEDLMQHDAIGETAKAESKNDACFG